MSSTWRTLSALFDGGTGLCAGVNSLYFALRLASGGERSSSRVAALLALWLLSFGALVEAVALLALSASGHSEPLAMPHWTVVRGLTFVGAATVSALICRRMVSR